MFQYLAGVEGCGGLWRGFELLGEKLEFISA